MNQKVKWLGGPIDGELWVVPSNIENVVVDAQPFISRENIGKVAYLVPIEGRVLNWLNRTELEPDD